MIVNNTHGWMDEHRHRTAAAFTLAMPPRKRLRHLEESAMKRLLAWEIKRVLRTPLTKRTLGRHFGDTFSSTLRKRCRRNFSNVNYFGVFEGAKIEAFSPRRQALRVDFQQRLKERVGQQMATILRKTTKSIMNF